MVLDSQFYISISITVAHKYGISMQDNQSNIWHCLGVLLICVSYILGTSPNNAMKGSDGSTCLKKHAFKMWRQSKWGFRDTGKRIVVVDNFIFSQVLGKNQPYYNAFVFVLNEILRLREHVSIRMQIGSSTWRNPTYNSMNVWYYYTPFSTHDCIFNFSIFQAIECCT